MHICKNRKPPFLIIYTWIIIKMEVFYMKKLEKNEVLLWFGSWTSKIGNIVFDYANSMSIVVHFPGKHGFWLCIRVQRQ